MGDNIRRQRVGGEREAWGLCCWMREESRKTGRVVLRMTSEVRTILRKNTGKGPLP